jgi:hypothetical protein
LLFFSLHIFGVGTQFLFRSPETCMNICRTFQEGGGQFFSKVKKWGNKLKTGTSTTINPLPPVDAHGIMFETGLVGTLTFSSHMLAA